MSENKNRKNIENKRKGRISLKRSRSAIPMNTNISDFMSTGPLIRQISFKKRKPDPEAMPFKSNNDHSNHILQGNLTSLDVHDSKGNIVTDNESPSDKTDISHFHFDANSNCKSSINASSNLTIDLSKNNFIPSARPPKTPSIKSGVLEDWESYNFIPSGPSSKAGSCVTVNSIPNSIASFLRGIPENLRLGTSTNSISILDKNSWESNESELFIFDDVVHAHRNKLQVKLNQVMAHSNKRWLNIFQTKRAHIENDHVISQPLLPLSPPKNKEGFKVPAKVNHNFCIQNNRALQSLIKSDTNIIPQKIEIPNSNASHTIELCDSQSKHTKHNKHYDKRSINRSRLIDPVESSNEASCLVHQERIFSPNTNLKDSDNSPYYPEYIPGFSSLCIRDFLLDANSTV